MTFFWESNRPEKLTIIQISREEREMVVVGKEESNEVKSRQSVVVPPPPVILLLLTTTAGTLFLSFSNSLSTLSPKTHP